MQRTLNLGILAHVDAGKTTLTERLLYAAGVIDEIGSVDDGTTQTDSLALERQRGITIKSAVVSFMLPGRDDVTVNLIDTPGHPDFIAEVERVLNVLDGVVLVLSAVEGVQAQTRVLMRTLQRLGLPTVMFVNKIDRAGARPDDVVDEIRDKLTPAVVAMGSARGHGTRDAVVVPHVFEDAGFAARLADVLAERDEELLRAYVDGDAAIPHDRLWAALVRQTREAFVHPVYFGSAITGAGVLELTAALGELLPASVGDAEGPVSGTVFKVNRGPAGEKIAYVRMFTGTLHVRDRVGDEQKATAINVFADGSDVQTRGVSAGQIGKLWGLADVRIGDAIGRPAKPGAEHYFAPPTLETVVVPSCPSEKGALHAALAQLAEQDPLIDLRQDDVRQELFLSLYGEVQKEVIEATLAREYGLDVTFRETTPICIERLTGKGSAIDLLGKNPFLATVGLTVEPAPIGAGITFVADVDVRSVPLYVFKTVEEFTDSMTAYVTSTLRQGLYGWEIPDCAVKMTDCDYLSPGTKAYHFRYLTPLVLMAALKRARTAVCEPIHLFHLECPGDTLGTVLSLVARLGALPQTPVTRGDSCIVQGTIAAARMHELQRALGGATRGEGVLECEFDRYEPVQGKPPTRRRTGPDPSNRADYLRLVTS